MNSSTNNAVSVVSFDKLASLATGASPAELSDSELLVATRLLTGRSNQLLASLLAHLGEVEARGVHRTRACSSLYTYCVYELRLSEDEAYRRVAAARLVRRFPALLNAVAAGELHLTGLLMLGPHLTNENLVEVLARAKHRTKKEIARLVRELDPLPDVPSRIEPLGPAPARSGLRAPTFAQYAQSLCPVRELTPGDRPRDWMVSEPELGSGEPALATEAANSVLEQPPALERTGSSSEQPSAPARAGSSSEQPSAPERPEPAESEGPELEPTPARLAPQRFSVQFTASEEYVKLVEEAQALSGSRTSLDELHLRAMRALLAELKRKKYAVTTRPRQRAADARPDESQGAGAQTDEIPPASTKPRRRGRYIPAEVRRAVFQRDEGRCTFTDSSGQRCRETCDLELHHEFAFGRGGEHAASNITLRCRAHNALAAEEDFGKAFIERQREDDHERWTAIESEARRWERVDDLAHSAGSAESAESAESSGDPESTRGDEAD